CKLQLAASNFFPQCVQICGVSDGKNDDDELFLVCFQDDGLDHLPAWNMQQLRNLLRRISRPVRMRRIRNAGIVQILSQFCRDHRNAPRLEFSLNHIISLERVQERRCPRWRSLRPPSRRWSKRRSILRLVVDASEEPFRLPEGRESRLNSQPPLNKICYRLHDGSPLCKKPSA